MCVNWVNYVSIIIYQLMSSAEQDQQVTFKYLFIITPLEIKSSSKIKNNSKKSILIKLGNKTSKCTQLNTPLQLEIEVLYSKTLQKYCPIKGIIKIYDVSEDGAEIISCVGGFQTDQLLNEGKTKVTLEKEIGTSKLKMDINIINKTDKRSDREEKAESGHSRSISSKEITYEREREKPVLKKTPTDSSAVVTNGSSLSKTSIGGSQTGNVRNVRRNSFTSDNLDNSSSKVMEIPYKNTSSNINKSLEKINQALNFKRFQDSAISTKANQVLAKAELQTIKQQLTDQKRKNTQLQERCSKLNHKAASYKNHSLFYQNEVRSHLELQKKLILAFELGESNKLCYQLDETKKVISIKYKDRQVDVALKQFIDTAIKKINSTLPAIQTDIDFNDKDRFNQQLEQARKQITILKKLTMEKDKKLYSLEKQIEGIEVTIHNLKETNKHLNEENYYLREKNDQVELSIYHKESAIDSLKKQVYQYTDELQKFEGDLKNSELQIEELKEEVSNCTQTIERYREKYGDLKNVKNRAIEMDIKQCLRWIDQQNRDLQLSEMQQTMQSEAKDEREDSLSSVIRNIEIDKVPIQQMSIIRNQLLRILEKVDSLMSK